ncbi:hypothetical protein BN1356_00459 [Streptococcus varani]|uniref:Uncharacterized protein n=1 Tax=Streptococcus varani TaxID=1608583 RepID=A0A0E4H3S7_9STRE|nr:hypothetical protein [Streptococcus varani]CQR24096.1 hypothetical protein BN1356_00459 [Streptococcus varani]
MTKHIRERLERYSVEPYLKGKAELLTKGKEVIETAQLRRYSILDLLVSTLRFIDWKIWLIQLGLFLISIFLISGIGKEEKSSLIIQTLTGLMAVSVLFFMDELFKSFTSGMWELEESFKYNLGQHTMVKLLIFGLVDMFLILLLSLLTSNRFELPVLTVLVYLLVPYNIICIILFLLVTMWRNHLHRHIIWLTSGIVCLTFFLASNSFKIYQLSLTYWWLVCLGTALIFFYLLKQQFLKILGEDVFEWN